MMVSTKGRYALRVMIDLAEHGEKGEYVSLSDISERQEVSFKYLEAIVSSLFRAGMLESRRGKNGGYRLCRTPSEYSVGEILKAAEGDIEPVSCGGEECPRKDRCRTLPLWRELDGVIDRYLSGVTLADVLSGKVAGDGTENISTGRPESDGSAGK